MEIENYELDEDGKYLYCFVDEETRDELLRASGPIPVKLLFPKKLVGETYIDQRSIIPGTRILVFNCYDEKNKKLLFVAHYPKEIWFLSHLFKTNAWIFKIENPHPKCFQGLWEDALAFAKANYEKSKNGDLHKRIMQIWEKLYEHVKTT
jgi:hypothetical protein